MKEERAEKLIDILRLSTEYLKKNNIEEARLNAELMLCEILNCDRINLYLNFEKPLSDEEKDKFRDFLKRRVKREPLQYILGKANFFGYSYLVNKNVLIPRPETEFLVEKVILFAQQNERELYNIIEIGTGSGCISISLSKELEKINKKHKIFAIDSSDNAVELARKNSEINNINRENLTIKKLDIFNEEINFEPFNIVISNPPYIPYEEFLNLPEEIRLFEPASALTDFEDGLKFYKRIFQLLLQNRNKCTCFLEIGHNQKLKLEELLTLYNLGNYVFEKDLNNQYRYLIINV